MSMLRALTLSILAMPAAMAASPALEGGIGLGTWTWIGPLAAEQPVHPGFVLTFDEVVDRRLLLKDPTALPASLQDRAGSVHEVRLRRYPWIPESLILSPRFQQTGMVGASWRPLVIGRPLATGPVSLSADAGLRVTALYLWSSSLPDPADGSKSFFLRPGVDLSLDLGFALSDRTTLRIGAEGHAYLPQAISGFGLGRAGDRMALVARGIAEVRVRLRRSLPSP
ncbi:MAG: hypothetical protein EA397_11240 [Deltaproteobacteria bacterium]|nr:MAG: hypothetical protein EA397_11240 [Deltaproteobacteria bacterium]